MKESGFHNEKSGFHFLNLKYIELSYHYVLYWAYSMGGHFLKELLSNIFFI